jgi:hypothetical protein
VQDALSAPPALSSRWRGGGREMVMRSSLAARPSPASLLTERMSRAAKEARLAPAARSQKGPALSAREAKASPVTNSNGLNPFMSLPACFSMPFVTGVMLAPASDRTGRIAAAPGAPGARGGA